MSKEFGGVEEVLAEPPIKWLIPGWIPDRELSLLWGREGTYKSFIALDWSLNLAAANRTVVYIAAEGLSGLRNRVAAWLEYNERRKMPTWHYFNSNIYLNQKIERRSWMQTLNEYISQQKRAATPNLIVVDTLDRCFDGEENSSKEMGHFIDGLEALRAEYGCAVLVIHHTRKDGKRERGTSALPAAVFASHRVQEARIRAGGASVQLMCEKMKDAEMPKPRRIVLERQDFLHDITPELNEVTHTSLVVTESSIETKEAAKLDSDRALSEVGTLVQEHGSMTGPELAQIMGVSKKIANQRLYRAQRKGELKKDNGGTYTVA